MALKLVIIAVFAYVLGCVNSGVIISRYVFNTDIRKFGSISYSKLYGLFKLKGLLYVLASDVIKAIIVIALGSFILKSAGFPNTGKFTAIFFALLGQAFPITNGLKARKNVTWGGLLLLFADWRIFLICAIAFLILTGISKYVSLGSLVASVAYPVFVGILYGGWLRVLIAVGGSILVITMYRKNLLRILLNSGKSEAPPHDENNDSPHEDNN